MHPSDLLAEAKQIMVRSVASEAASRAATHAAYYALYHLMCTYFGLDPSKRDESSHADVMRRLDRLDLSSAMPYAAKARLVYKRLWSLRKSADYYFSDFYPHRSAVMAVSYADDVFNLCR